MLQSVPQFPRGFKLELVMSWDHILAFMLINSSNSLYLTLGNYLTTQNYVSFFNKLVYNLQDNIENRGKVWKAQMCRQQLLYDKHSMYFLFSFLLSSLPYSLFASFLSSFFLLNYPLDQLRIFGHGVYATNLPWGNCMCTIYSSIYHFDGNSLLYKHLSLDY